MVDQRHGVQGGRRLRVDGQKRTENEYKQMLRLAEIENRELKDSLRYVEMQLAKTKDQLRLSSKRNESQAGDIQNCHEQIARQANINHAQASQIEEMAKKIAEHDAVVKEAERQHQLKVQMLQNEVDVRECNINQIQKSLHTKEQDCTLLDTQLVTARDTINDLDSEMEMKAAENNRLREQLAEMEAVMSDLYRSRKGKGTLQIEIESLKSDNDYLLALLRDTCEYADCEDFDILKSAKTKALTGSKGFIQAQTANRRARCGTPDPTSQAGQQRPAKKINNDWIPTQAVRALEEIRKKYNSQMTETAISKILYDLNNIWRNIMRQESDAMKKRLQAQIQELRRQVVQKQAYDKGELIDEISNTKKQLRFANKQLLNKDRAMNSLNHKSDGRNSTMEHSTMAGTIDQDATRQMKLIESLGNEKKMLEDEVEELKMKVSQLLSQGQLVSTSGQPQQQRSHMLSQQRQGTFDTINASDDVAL